MSEKEPRSPWAEKLIRLIDETDDLVTRLKHFAEELQKLREKEDNDKLSKP